MTNLYEVTEERPIPSKGTYNPSRIMLYGVRLVRLQLRTDSVVCLPLNYSRRLALIYGFCYQGHCYSLPEPVIVLVNGPGVDAQGCGWDPNHYRCWEVDKLSHTIQLQAQSDTFEELILNRNLNANKQPVAYSIAHQMSHRGGKLTE
jgi:hypothetical protein